MEKSNVQVDISPAKDEGVLKEIKVEGEGEDTPGVKSTVYVHYTGTLSNGEKFDSSHDRGTLFKFTLGKGEVIKAWDIGIATMKKGEKCVLTCKPEYAYGDKGSPPKIPPKATLLFEVELDHWEDRDITNDGGVIMHVLTEGEGYSQPNMDACVSIHLRGTCQGKTFEERDVTFTLGEGAEHGICLGIEKALYEMKLHEKVRLTIKPAYGLTEVQLSDFGLELNSVIQYEIYLLSFEKAKEHWEMDLQEKLENSEKVKSKGQTYFKASNYTAALHQYERMIKILDVWKEDEKTKTNPVKCIAYLNAALCHLKLCQCTQAKDKCNSALEIEPKNVKAMYRRGQAHLGLKDYELGLKDFKAVLELEPDNRAAKDQVSLSLSLLAKQKEKEKKLYGDMFAKMAKQSEKEEAAKERERGKRDVIKMAYEEAIKEEQKMQTDDSATKG